MKHLYYMIVVLVLLMFVVSCDDALKTSAQIIQGGVAEILDGSHEVNGIATQVTKDTILVEGINVKDALLEADPQGEWKSVITDDTVGFVFVPSKDIPASSTGFPKKDLVAGQEYPIEVTIDEDTGLSITGSDIMGNGLDTTVKPIEGEHVVNNKTVEVTKDDVVIAGKSVKQVLQSVDANGVWRKVLTKTGEVQFIFMPSKNIPASSTGFPKKALVAGTEYPIVITNDKETGMSITGPDIVGDGLNPEKSETGESGSKTVVPVVPTPQTKSELQALITKRINSDGNTADLTDIDVRNITDMSSLFKSSGFNGDISGWDVSNVTNMTRMFWEAKFNGDISQWDVSSVTNMNRMFEGAQFNGDISQWDVSNVTNMGLMFYGSQFNGDISGWDVSNVTDMNLMFSWTFFNGDISKWDTSSVTNMGRMFFTSKRFNRDISGWDVSNVTNMARMFYDSSFNHDISKWDVSKVTNMESMFKNVTKMTYNLEAWGSKLRKDKRVDKRNMWDGSGVEAARNKPTWV